MARPAKVTGLRTTRVIDAEGPEAPAVPDKKQGVYQFQSRAAALRLSLRRRRIVRGPDNEAVEEAPRASDETDAPLDWVLFENNYFETESKELAELIEEKARKAGFWGVGREVWSISEAKAAQDAALEAELRERIKSRPDIARRVLTPGEAEDFALPPPPAA